MILCLYGYDPLDRLASTSRSVGMTRHFYQADRPVSEVELQHWRTLLLADQIPLAQVQFPATGTQDSLLATDRQHSVLAALLAGLRVDSAYSPYGHQQPAGTWPGFNGQPRDPSTGHYLLGNGYRAYNPVLGRFNSPDSLSPFGKGGLNAYAYCAGDPLNRSDPDGHFTLGTALTYGWSGLAFLRSKYALYNSWDKVKSTFHRWTRGPAFPHDAAGMTDIVMDGVTTTTALLHATGGSLAFAGATMRLAGVGVSSTANTVIMGGAVGSGSSAFALQVFTPWIKKRVMASMSARYGGNSDVEMPPTVSGPVNTASVRRPSTVYTIESEVRPYSRLRKRPGSPESTASEHSGYKITRL